jgi:hypothetical protein
MARADRRQRMVGRADAGFDHLGFRRLSGRDWASFGFCVRRPAITRSIQFFLHLLPRVECHGRLALRRRVKMLFLGGAA